MVEESLEDSLGATMEPGKIEAAIGEGGAAINTGALIDTGAAEEEEDDEAVAVKPRKPKGEVLCIGGGGFN